MSAPDSRKISIEVRSLPVAQLQGLHVLLNPRFTVLDFLIADPVKPLSRLPHRDCNEKRAVGPLDAVPLLP